jgi:hypothetical protein
MNHYGKLTLDGHNLGSGSYGHAMICCGYRPEGLFLQNSWGVDSKYLEIYVDG